MRSLFTNKEDCVREPTYDGFEGGNRGELLIESKDEALPSMHLLY